jgi:hypothetical protein
LASQVLLRDGQLPVATARQDRPLRLGEAPGLETVCGMSPDQPDGPAFGSGEVSARSMEGSSKEVARTIQQSVQPILDALRRLPESPADSLSSARLSALIEGALEPCTSALEWARRPRDSGAPAGKPDEHLRSAHTRSRPGPCAPGGQFSFRDGIQMAPLRSAIDAAFPTSTLSAANVLTNAYLSGWPADDGSSVTFAPP